MSRFDLGALRSRDELTAAGKDLSEEIKSDDVASLAAAVSFKIVLALFPAMIAAIGIFSRITTAQDLERLLQNLSAALPAGVVDFLDDALQRLIANKAAGGVAAVLGVLGGLWAASSAAVTVNKALTRAFDETEDRKFVGMRASALLVTVALLLALVGMFLLLIVGGNIERSVVDGLPLTETARGAIEFASEVARYVLAVVLGMLLFAFIYWVGPDYERRPSWAWITPGAVVGVITFLIASTLFGVYTSYSGTYTGPDSIYGSLGSAILFMLWLQITMFALLLGAEVNQVLQMRARARAVPAGSRGAEPAGDDRDALPSDMASVTPVASRAGAHIRLPDDQHGDGSGRSPRGQDAGDASDLVAAAATTWGAERDRSGEGAEPAGSPRAVAVHDHDVAARVTRADGAVVAGGHSTAHGPADERRLPVPTLVGAAVATVSSLVGLAGLLRRLKGD